jgi:hypothetical protein
MGQRGDNDITGGQYRYEEKKLEKWKHFKR